MKVLSIDIGMRHLAHCLLEVEGGIKIQDWDVIDLTTSECCFRCSKAAFYRTHNGGCCKTHAPNLPALHALKKDTIEALCDTHKIARGARSEMLQALSVIKKRIKIQTASTVDLARALATAYATLPDVDVVLVENQMASRMAVVQGMVIQFWALRKVPCIEVVSPANKLQCLKLGKTTYTERKKRSVEYTITLLRDLSIEVDISAHKKRDDLADTFLQAMWWLKKNKHL